MALSIVLHPLIKKKFVLSYVLTFFLTLFCVGSLNFLVDPLQYYKYNPRYPLWWNEWQVASFIKTFPFDSIVIGSSMTQNFSPRYIQSRLGGHFIKLSISGSDAVDQTIVLRQALSSRKIKKILWGIDPILLRLNQPRKLYIPLFKRTLSGHLAYLCNANMTYFSYCRLFKNETPAKDELDHYNNWNKGAVFSKKIILEQYYKETQGKKLPFSQNLMNQKYQKQAIIESESKHYADTHSDLWSQMTAWDHRYFVLKKMVSIIAAHPHVQFIIFFPPYSLAYCKARFYNNTDDFVQDACFREHIMRVLIAFPNVRFFDFQIDTSTVANLDYYKDLTHYSEDINKKMIDQIVKGQFLVRTQADIMRAQKAYLALPFHPIESLSAEPTKK